jgi:hypothetical protein
MAATCAVRYSRRSVALAGVLIAATPLVLHLAGGVNPSSLEISAGIALFAALFPLVTQPGPVARPLVHAAGLSAVLLAQARTPGPLWLAILGLGLVVLTPWSRLRTLARDRAVRWWLGPIAIFAILSAVYTVAFKASEVVPSGASYTMWNAFKIMFTLDYLNYLVEAIGVLGWVDSPLPSPAYIVWLIALGGVVAAAFVGGHKRERWTIVLLGVLGFNILTLAQAYVASRSGLVMQGRYLWPILSSIPVLSGYLVSRFGLPDRIARSAVRSTVVFLVPIHLFALEFTLARWMHGESPGYPQAIHLNPFHGSWLPVDGLALPYALMILGVLAMIAVVWKATGRDSARGLPPDPATRPSGEADPAAESLGVALSVEALQPAGR